MTLTRCILALFVALAAGATGDLRAQEPAEQYPSRPVTFIVPFAPGGTTGLLARVLSQKLEQRLGKSFVVEHRPGGGGTTAAIAVARGVPDGYTIMMASSTVMAINVTVRKNLSYDPRTELTPIALLARVPYVLLVNPELPIKSVDDLVNCSKAFLGSISCMCLTRVRCRRSPIWSPATSR
jgi:tripartite-type tricarboxylate transporter receptor subunit TctC